MRVVEAPFPSPSVLALWSQHEAELRRWLFARAPLKADVDDLLQEVFIKTLRQGERLQALTMPRAWLFEVTRNTLIDRLRSGPDLLPLPGDLDQWPEQADVVPMVDALAQACLPRVLSELAPQDREAIELCDLQGMAQSDFARLMNLTLPAAKSRVQRARRRMRERMTSACQLSFDAAGRVDDFVPRAPLPVTSSCCMTGPQSLPDGPNR